MSRFADDATVEARHKGPLPGPGHRFPQADVTLTEVPQAISGAQANTMVDMLPHTFVTAGDVAFEVVSEGTDSEGTDSEGTEPKAGATDAAAELADEAGLALADIKGTGANGRVLKSDVQSAIDADTNTDADIDTDTDTD